MLFAVAGMGLSHGRHRATIVKMIIAAAVTAATMLLVQNWGSIFNPTPRPVRYTPPIMSHTTTLFVTALDWSCPLFLITNTGFASPCSVAVSRGRKEREPHPGDRWRGVHRLACDPAPAQRRPQGHHRGTPLIEYSSNQKTPPTQSTSAHLACIALPPDLTTT